MAKNYISRENFPNVIHIKNGLCLLICATALNSFSAQSARVKETSTEIVKLSTNRQIGVPDVPAVIPTIQKNSKSIALNGNYIIGVGGAYTTITAAVADFNSAAITGPVTFTLTDSTYPAETFPITINANAGSSSTNQLLIKPGTGVNATISGNSTSILKINGADYVTVDGSNNGSTSRNLTLNNVNPTSATNPTIAWVASTATDGADFTTFKNVKFLGLSPSITVAGLISSGATLGTPGTIPNNNLRIDNNSFNRAQNAVYAAGPSSALDVSLYIANNLMGSTDPLEKLGYRGLAVLNSTNFVIYNNIIKGITNPTTATSAGMLLAGTIRDATIVSNKIDDIFNTNSGGYGAAGIYLACIAGSSNLSVINNFISNVVGSGFNLGGAEDNGNGILVDGAATNIKIFYNTVSMNTNQAVAGRPSAINVVSTFTTAGSIDLRNNIFSNTQTTAGERYAIYSAAAKTVFSNIDYNDYYSTGPNLAYFGAAPVLDLAALKTAFGGNTFSKNVLPIFTSSTDLHLTPANTLLDNKGVSLPGINFDIDNEVRNLTTPDIGADEFFSTLATQDLSKNSLKIYPNPVVDFVKINFSTNIDSVETFNTNGQKVDSQVWNSKAGQLDMRNLPAGMYMIKIKAGNDVKSFKVIKK